MKITSDWDKLAFALTLKKQPKSGKFVSRMNGRTASGENFVAKSPLKHPRKGVTRVQFEDKPSPKVRRTKEGKIYFQTNTGKGFGPKLEISASLAAKLGV